MRVERATTIIPSIYISLIRGRYVILSTEITTNTKDTRTLKPLGWFKNNNFSVFYSSGRLFIPHHKT